MANLGRKTNRLIDETSPYLHQHADNPVDWYPWGPEALARARQLDRPIFLSIGYSACHWCHVMEHESFEDPEVAKVLNENFISIKVDREERPDLDQIYMTAVQMLTGQGGWPMSIWLTPDLEPFYGGTYFPPDDRYGRPSFKRVLTALADAWRSRREEIVSSAAQITAQVRSAAVLPRASGDLEPRLLTAAADAMGRIFDSTFGGFGQAPKFPHAIELRLLLRIWKRFADDNALHMARLTLDRMAQGGIYDHLGGGFHRYSTDGRWLVPHFEKMLYDNALLALAYIEAWQAVGEPVYRSIVEETLAYVLREMRSSEGPFFSAQDADSEGEEGKFFAWSLKEVEEILGKEAADVFTYVYDITAGGNWEGSNILHRSKSDEQDARMLGISVNELRGSLEASRKKLFEVRERRVKPARDEKMIVSWNGLMIDALALCAQVLNNDAYSDAAARAADFILASMRDPEGRLHRTYSSGSAAKLHGCLEDYAFLLNGLVTLYEATFEPRWIDSAVALANIMIEDFWDEKEGGFYFTSRRQEQVLMRTKDPHDSSIPSANSMAVTALLRLSRLSGQSQFADRAETTLRLFAGWMQTAPLAAGQMLTALDFYLGPVLEFAMIGESKSADTLRALSLIRGSFRPTKVVAFQPRGEPVPSSIPLLAGKTSRETVTTYICQNYTCEAPVVGVEALEAALAETGGPGEAVSAAS